MENEVIEFDIGLGGGGDDSVAIIDDEEMTDDSPTAAMVGTSSGSLFFDTSTYGPQRDLDLEPFEGMEFESEEAAKGFYNSYARRVGVILEERGNDAFSGYLESHTVRYNTLRHEAFKFVEEGAESVDTYNVAMVALEEAARKVAMSAKNEGTGFMVNGRIREDSRSNGTLTKMDIGNHCGHLDQNLSEDEMDRKIEELKQEVDSGRRKCEVYRSNLVSVLRDIEDHKQQLSLKVQIIKYSMKDCL
ncbi:unnamed protein product [Lactuca saligna]|uniref:Protein FAR1-RELATED SEQUENCE n=1 Tax=Lactuca saligna TaxID=75948 RepID=A0AA36EMU9_LACSI|nr:unnamed protein product [Lactuca saligna]